MPDYDLEWPGKWKYSLSKRVHKKELTQYILEHQNKKLYLSKEVAKLFQRDEINLFVNLVKDAEQASEVLFYSFEFTSLLSHLKKQRVF